MSTIKKLLALVLALTMVLSVSAAAYSVVPYGDAEAIAEGAEVAVEMLYNMGIMKGDDKGNFNPNATITRAEVAKMIYVILNYGKDDKAVNYTGAKFFTDVEAGAWYEGYVNYAASIKLVQGRPDGTFGPNAPITCAEAAKMLLTAIGYSAEARGYVGAGWDQQVLSDASIIGLLKGYDYNTNTYAPRQWVAVMFKNALLKAYTYSTIAPVVFNGLLTGVNDSDYEYETMGEKYFDIKEFKGVVTANKYANLYGEEGISSGRTILDDNGIKLKVDTDLNDLGERRWGYYNTSNNAVYYFGDTGTNVVYSTGDATTIAKKYVGVYVDEAEYFVNFDAVEKAYDESVDGDWLKVIDYNDDGEADYVFKTEFIMTEVQGLSKGGVLTLSGKTADVKFDDGDDYIEFTTEDELGDGDIVLYTVIDKMAYVELAPNFVGEAEKYTYKADSLTVDGEDYVESDIANYTGYPEELENVARKTEYTFYKDWFNHIRIYTLPEYANGELVLLTDAYYGTDRSGKIYAVDAYLNGEIADYDVNAVYYSDYDKFIQDSDTADKNNWDRLVEFGKGTTNLARYFEDEGELELYLAKTYGQNKDGTTDYTDVTSDYIDLKDEGFKSGTATFKGADDKAKIQATKNTVFYYVYRNNSGEAVVNTVVGHKNSVDVVKDVVGIVEMYAVATDVTKEASDVDADGSTQYWVADVIVIETEKPCFNLNKTDIVLGYNVVNKTVKDYELLNVVNADATLGTLDVISLNGEDYDDGFKYDNIDTAYFYFNTENEDGESYIVKLGGTGFEWDKYGIYAETINRTSKLGSEYVVTADGDIYYYDETTVVYDLSASTNKNSITSVDSYKDALTLVKGNQYILFTDGEGNVIYAVLVNSYDDPAADLWLDITGVAADELGAAKATAKAALKAYVKAVAADTDARVADVTEADLAEVLDEAIDALYELTEKADVEAYAVNPTGAGVLKIWNKALEIQKKYTPDTYTLTVANGTGAYVIIDGATLTTDAIDGLAANQVVTLTTATPVAVVVVDATGATAVMKGAPTTWEITVTGDATIQVVPMAI